MFRRRQWQLPGVFPFRRSLAGVSLVAMMGASLAACGDPAHDLQVGTVGYVTGFAGGIVSAEPRATLVARDTLAAGGTAADAAVAMAFTLAVTLPSSAGLGAGGVCVVHDHAAKSTETLEFLPPTAEAAVRGMSAPAEARPVAMPTMPRAMYALYSRFGRLRWEQLVMPAETMARFGEPVSRALARDVAMAAPRIGNDPFARKLFAAENGQGTLREGDILRQPELAGVLGRLRQKGVGDFYGGQLSKDYIGNVQQIGGIVSLDAMRDYAPQWRPTSDVKVGYDILHAPSAGLSGDELIRVWGGGEAPGDQAPGIGGTGFVVADRFGSAVACALTMNGPFGVGRMVPGMGMFVVAPAPAEGRSRMPLSAALLVNHNSNEFHLGAAAVGGGAVPMLRRWIGNVAAEGKPPADAIRDVTSSAGPAIFSGLACMEGLPSQAGSCRVAVDPRAAGYGELVGVDKMPGKSGGK